MSSGLQYRSLKRLATAPGFRQLVQRVRHEQDELKLAIGRLETHLLSDRKIDPEHLEDAEFKVFSQFGEDGIIQYVLRHARVQETTFVELGSGNYRESNTRFLLQNNNWRGIVVDGGTEHQDFILRSGLAWRHDVEPISTFITRENVNETITSGGLSGQIGLLSIDVDGMDYWLWDAINVIQPAVVVMEYNALFGPAATITVPYDPEFVYSTAHYSRTYFGASLGALHHLARARGYRLLGCTSTGANAFFVRDELAGDLPARTTQEAFRDSRFLTARNEDGTLSRMRDRGKRLELIQNLSVIDVTTGNSVTVGEATNPTS